MYRQAAYAAILDDFTSGCRVAAVPTVDTAEVTRLRTQLESMAAAELVPPDRPADPGDSIIASWLRQMMLGLHWIRRLVHADVGGSSGVIPALQQLYAAGPAAPAARGGGVRGTSATAAQRRTACTPGTAAPARALGINRSESGIYRKINRSL